MGWLWSSPDSPTESSGNSGTDPGPVAAQQNHVPSTTPTAETPSSTPRRQPTRDEIAEQELQAFLEEFESDVRPNSTNYNRAPKSLPDQSTIPKPAPQTLEEELLPTEMSCRQAFDAAFYCQSLGGQFNNLYRYGGIRSCSENWKDFWFCMRTKSYIPRQKEGMIREHYRRKSLKYRVGPSSEDVWEARDRKLEWAEAFSEPIEAPAGSDEEWNRQEILRREGKS